MHRPIFALLLALAAACSTASNAPGDDSSGDDAGTGDGAMPDAPGTFCTDGDRRCGSGNQVEECSNKVWDDGELCPLGCTAGTCSTSTTCAPAARACFGTVVGICNATGTAWLFESACAATCTSGLCTGACTPDARRCNANTVEQCASDAVTWLQVDSCMNGCDVGQCVLDRLDVTTDMDVDGVVIVDGPVNVFAGATLRSPSGTLTIRATSITVDLGGSIAAIPAGTSSTGAGGAGAICGSSRASGGGGGHATRGLGGILQGFTCGGSGGSVFGSPKDISGLMGGPGGNGQGGAPGGRGGGVIRLFAPTITIAGTVSANGGAGAGTGFAMSGAGAGGTVLIAADSLTISGAVSASGAGTGAGSGGLGRVKLVWGSQHSLTGTFVGERSDSISPPIDPASVTHPDPNRYYNDAFQTFALTWSRPFSTVQGTYWRRDLTPIFPPTPATGTLATGEAITVSRDQFVAGENFLHFVSINSMTQIGTMESTFRLRLNTTPPALTSPTHPDGATWSTNHDPLVAWTVPNGDANHTGVYYVLDHNGRTVPTKNDTFVPISQHQVLHAGVADGIWALHAISIDHAGNLTRNASHYIFRIGPDPGVGRVLGQVSGPAGAIASATIEFNGGLITDQATNSGGAYNNGAVPAGTWQVTASAPGLKSQTKTVVVPAGGELTADFQLVP